MMNNKSDKQRKAMFANINGKKRTIFATGGMSGGWHIDPAYSDVVNDPLQRNVERYLRQIRQVGYNQEAVKNIFKTQIMKDYPMPNEWPRVFDMVETIVDTTGNPRRNFEMQKLSELRSQISFSKLPTSIQDKFPFKIDLTKP